MSEKKHAFLIGAYQNPEYLKHFILSLNGDRSNFYIHINKANLSAFEELKKFFKQYPNVCFVPSIKIRWGGITLLKSMDIMMSKALDNPENEFFHFLTGQDILIKPLKELYVFFDENADKNFILAHNQPSELDSDLYNHFFYQRYSQFHFYDYLDYRSRKFQYYIGRAITKILTAIIGPRKPVFANLIRCSSWFSINRIAAERIVDFLHKKGCYRWLGFSFAPDEMFVASLLCNCSDSKVFNLQHDNLRIIKFPRSGGDGSPNVLTECDYQDLKISNAFFARKIDPKKSSKLIELVYGLTGEENKSHE